MNVLYATHLLCMFSALLRHAVQIAALEMHGSAAAPKGSRQRSHHLLNVCPGVSQVLGRNLEALVTRAQEIKADWQDEFVSVEHMLLAFLDDTKFGTQLLKDVNLDKAKLEAAIKEIRGSNRVTDQVCSFTHITCCTYHMLAQWKAMASYTHIMCTVYCHSKLYIPCSLVKGRSTVQ